MDRVANQKGLGIRIVLVSPERVTMEKPLWLRFLAINNKAKYKAFWAGLNTVKKLGDKDTEVFCDSRLISGQVRGEFEAKDQRMQWYLCQVKQLQSNFEVFSIKQVPRSKTGHADSLAALATSLGEVLPRVIMVKDLVASN